MSRIASGPSSVGVKSKGWFALMASLFAVAAAAAGPGKTPLPQSDQPGSADDPLIGRYSGSVILVYERRSRGDAELLLGKLQPIQPDARRNTLRAAAKKTVEGQRTHFLYYAGKEASPLEVVRNYQEEIKARGGRTLFECREEACGGSPIGNVFYGGKDGMMDYLYPLKSAEAAKIYKAYSPEWCAMYVPTKGLQYATIELPGGSGFAAIAAYSGGGQVPTYCTNFVDGTFVSVDLVDTTPKRSRIINVNAAEMDRALQGSGRIALYGIYFDFDRAEVKPESDAALEQIAKLMKERPSLKLLVVGHTDNTGSFDGNIGLSQRRADAVVDALSSRYGVRQDRLKPVGVSYAAPVAPNKTEDGRAKNRRVELVEQ